MTDVDVAVATSSQSGKLKREVGRPPSSHERGTDRLPPAKPVSPSGVRPPSQGGRPRGRDTQQGLLLKSNQLRHTATVLAEESSPPPTRPGTAASLVSVNAGGASGADAGHPRRSVTSSIATCIAGAALEAWNFPEFTALVHPIYGCKGFRSPIQLWQ